MDYKIKVFLFYSEFFNKKMKKKLLKKYDLKIGTFYFYDNFIVGEIKKGMHLDFKSGAEMFQLAQTYYQNLTPIVYISNRVNSYSLVPTEHYQHKSPKVFPNLKGYAIVTYDMINRKIAELELSFINIPTNVFDSLEEAIKWVDKLIISD